MSHTELVIVKQPQLYWDYVKNLRPQCNHDDLALNLINFMKPMRFFRTYFFQVTSVNWLATTCDHTCNWCNYWETSIWLSGDLQFQTTQAVASPVLGNLKGYFIDFCIRCRNKIHFYFYFYFIFIFIFIYFYFNFILFLFYFYFIFIYILNFSIFTCY